MLIVNGYLVSIFVVFSSCILENWEAVSNNCEHCPIIRYFCHQVICHGALVVQTCRSSGLGRKKKGSNPRSTKNDAILQGACSTCR